jgi:hypothetical protein
MYHNTCEVVHVYRKHFQYLFSVFPSEFHTAMIPDLIPSHFCHGVNPIPPPDPNAPLSKEDLHRKRLHEAYQRHRLDFTIRELEEVGCWDKPDARPSSLRNPVHPIFQQHLWAIGNVPLGNGYPGNLEMSNPLVWIAMLPSLRLATLLLRRATVLPWYVGST